MMGRSHFVLAGAAYAALVVRPLETPLGTLAAPLLGAPWLVDERSAQVLSLAIVAACGLGPDLDKAGSTAARSLGVVTRVLSWGIERGFGHRKGFHSLVGAALAFLLGELLGAALGLTHLGALVTFGWLAHLLTDAWTVRGVPLLWPVITTPLKLPPRLVTGSRAEELLLAVVLIGLLFYATGGQVPRL